MASGQAKAETLSLDCSINGEILTNVWVDTDKSTVTTHSKGSPGSNTFPAQITISSISWSVDFSRGKAISSIDRTTGILTPLVHPDLNYYPQQCVKGTTPLPATKF